MKLLRGRGERVGASYLFDATLTRFAELMDGGMHMMNEEVSKVIRVVRIASQQSMHVDIRGGEFAIDEHEVTGELFRFLKDG